MVRDAFRPDGLARSSSLARLNVALRGGGGGVGRKVRRTPQERRRAAVNARNSSVDLQYGRMYSRSHLHIVSDT